MDQKIAIGAGVAVVLAAGVFWLWPEKAATPVVEPTVVAMPDEPAIKHSVPELAEASQRALPELAGSDAAVANSAESIFGAAAIAQWLVPDQIVKHVVVTLDNLPRKKFAERQKPIKAVPGRFIVEGTDEKRTIGADNAARYASMVQLVQSLDMSRVGAEYFRLYPLFQEAYKDLGYPDGYFNDRLVTVIDDLLAAPEVSGPIAVVQPNVMYEYADPALENLSAGQKAMIRLGPGNAATIKKKLQELRAVVATHKPAS